MPLDEGATQYDLMPLDGAASNLCVVLEYGRAGEGWPAEHVPVCMLVDSLMR
jgi:hypothetical protein